ncbi:MAG: hypothetical protein FWC65_02190 [Treponema sp.]|nr:hypothetical protein [Treponema sp.]
MDISKPISAALFLYECFRLSLLIAFLFVAQSVGIGVPLEILTGGAFFPYIAYLGSTALFPLMALFIWLRPQEHRNYIALYMAGKVIGVVLFYAWAISPSGEFTGMENLQHNRAVLLISIGMNMADVFSIWGACTLKNRARKTEIGGL